MLAEVSQSTKFWALLVRMSLPKVFTLTPVAWGRVGRRRVGGNEATSGERKREREKEREREGEREGERERGRERKRVHCRFYRACGTDSSDASRLSTVAVS